VASLPGVPERLDLAQFNLAVRSPQDDGGCRWGLARPVEVPWTWAVLTWY